MRKLTRKSLEELAKTLPVIEDRFQKSYVGGGDGTSTSPYTAAEFDNMLSDGSWNGGYVDGMGYVGNDTVCTNDNPSNAGGDGTSANPYTQDEFYSMVSDGSWNGGYVEGWGYTFSEVPCTDNFTGGSDVTRSDLIGYLVDNGSGVIISLILDLVSYVPGIGTGLSIENYNREQGIKDVLTYMEQNGIDSVYRIDSENTSFVPSGTYEYRTTIESKFFNRATGEYIGSIYYHW